MNESISKLLSSLQADAEEKLKNREKVKVTETEERYLSRISSLHEKLDKAKANKTLVTRLLIKSIIENYINILDKKIRNMGELNAHSFVLYTHIWPNIKSHIYRNFIEYYKNNKDNQDISFLGNIEVNRNYAFNIIYEGLPLVRFKNPEIVGAKEELGLFDKEFFLNYGIEFKRLVGFDDMSTELKYEKLEEFINKILFSDFDYQSVGFTDEEIEKYRKRIRSLNHMCGRVKAFRERCDIGLERILCEIGKDFIENGFKKDDAPSSKKYYISRIPIVTSYRPGPSELERRTILLNVEMENNKKVVEEKLGTKTVDQLKWLRNYTCFEKEDLIFFQTQKGNETVWLPVVYSELEEELNNCRWSYTFYSTKDGKKAKICDGLEVKVNSLDFTNRIIEEAYKQNRKKTR